VTREPQSPEASARPRVSIGLPVYNGERYLRECLDSILGQSFRDFELVIGDNASTDGTAEICREYAARDARIRYTRRPENLGAAENYNRVFRESRGEFFKWAAHDDVMGETFLEACVHALEGDPGAILAFPETMHIDASGKPTEKYNNDLHLDSASAVARFRQCVTRRNLMCTPVFGVFRSEVLAKTSLIGKYSDSDQVLLAHLALLGRFSEVPGVLMFRRIHADASRRANRTIREVTRWFDPHKKWVHPPTLVNTLGYLECVSATRLSITEKLACWMLVARKLWGARRRVRSEARELLTTRGAI
jgi:glycosyltransferase involved in cell wall biosynthesis